MFKKMIGMKKALLGLLSASLIFPSMVIAHPQIQLLDGSGNPIKDQLNYSDTVKATNGSVYVSGPAYSPKQTCGKCHDYQAVTKAYHFREGAGRNGENLSDQWSDKENDGTLYKYLANAYGHLLSPGQYGAW
jgi:hypothetical protein